MKENKPYREPWEKPEGEAVSHKRLTKFVVAMMLIATLVMALCVGAVYAIQHLPTADDVPLETDAGVVVSESVPPETSEDPDLAPGKSPMLPQVSPPNVDGEMNTKPQAGEETTYTLTVYYRDFETGAQLLPTYVVLLESDEQYSVPSPLMSGYWASPVMVEGWMPNCDVYATVFYFPISDQAVPTDSQHH